MPRDWLTVTEAAKLADVTQSAVCKWIERHKLGASGNRRDRRIQRAQFDAFMKMRQPPPPPKGWLTVDEAAERIGIKRHVVYTYRMMGLIKGRMDAFRRLLLSEPSVAAYVKHRDAFYCDSKNGYLSISQAAEYMRTSRQAVFSLLRRGRILAKRDGVRVWVNRKSVDTFLRNHRMVSRRRDHGGSMSLPTGKRGKAMVSTETSHKENESCR